MGNEHRIVFGGAKFQRQECLKSFLENPAAGDKRKPGPMIIEHNK